MLLVHALTRRYDALLALDAVSLEVQPGQIVGLLGANGAGKSTLLRTAAGLQPPDSGKVQICEVSLWDEPVAAKHKLGYAPEDPSFYEDLSADEYLAFLASVRGLDPTATRDRALDLAERLGLLERRHEPVRRFSYGMRKKLSFMAAVLHRPAVLLCDEALEGFDAAAALVAKQEIRELARSGSSVLFSSHVTETTERLCDRVVVLHQGRIARELDRADWGGVPQDVSQLEQVFLDIIRGSASKEAS